MSWSEPEVHPTLIVTMQLPMAKMAKIQVSDPSLRMAVVEAVLLGRADPLVLRAAALDLILLQFQEAQEQDKVFLAPMDLPGMAMLPPEAVVALAVLVPADCMALMAMGGAQAHPQGVMAGLV